MENLTFKERGPAKETSRGDIENSAPHQHNPASQSLERLNGSGTSDAPPLAKTQGAEHPAVFLLTCYLSAAGAFAAGEDAGCPGASGADLRGAVCGLIAVDVFVDCPEG